MPDSTPVIEIKNLHQSFGNLEVLKGVAIPARRGAVVSLNGPNRRAF